MGQNILGPKKVFEEKKFDRKKFESKNLVAKNGGSKTFLGQKNLEGWGSKLCALVPWSIGSLHTKSWPPTMPGNLRKVLGRWWWWVGGGSYTKFSVLLWAKALVLA